ncbi:MAG TPA: hypothetical protein VK254_01345 [Candidatus Bathyarchaeia archaeon]|nr:hypothetical protein [Candidatus Bathyarchaeia archaeon]
MRNILKIIILAAISAAFAIVAEQLVATAASVFWQREIVLESYMHITWFLALSAVIEEISKYWAIYFVIRKNFGIEKMKFVVASLLLGAAWGIFEIGLVLFSDQNSLAAFRYGNREILFSFAAIAALHALTAFLMGVFISAGTFSGKFKQLKILFFPVLIHLLFNFLLIQKSNFTNFLIIFSLGMFLVIGISILAFKAKKLA